MKDRGGANAGRFKPYAAYQDSGVEPACRPVRRSPKGEGGSIGARRCLGEIPGHWHALKLKRVCTFA